LARKEENKNFLIKIKIPSELSIFTDSPFPIFTGKSYFLEKEDKRGPLTKKKVEKSSCLKKRTTSLF
jgi:hypothetical protein